MEKNYILNRNILRLIANETDMKTLLDSFFMSLDTRNINIHYYVYEEEFGNKNTNDKSLVDHIKLCDKEYSEKKIKNNYILCFKFDILKIVFKIHEIIDKDEINKIKEELRLFAYMMLALEELLVYKRKSFISPVFYEVSKILYDVNRSLESTLEDFAELMTNILGINIIRIEKFDNMFFSAQKTNKNEEITLEYKYKDMKIKYIEERLVQNIGDTAKILEVIFLILNNFLELKEIYEKKEKILNAQIKSIENEMYLKKVLQDALSNVITIIKKSTEIEKTDRVEEILPNIGKLVNEYTSAEYVLVQCGEAIYEIGKKNLFLEKKELSYENITEGKIPEDIIKTPYKIIIEKKKILSEDTVYLNAIYFTMKTKILNIILSRYLADLKKYFPDLKKSVK